MKIAALLPFKEVEPQGAFQRNFMQNKGQSRSVARKGSQTTPKSKSKPCQYPDQGDLRKEIESLIADPERWLNTPNDQFGGRTPVDLLGTEEEYLVREWVGAVKYGIMS